MPFCLRRIAIWVVLLAGSAFAYEEKISDADELHQVCSGMWGGGPAHIEVSFDTTSRGQLAMVIYEWGDMRLLGKVTSTTDDSLPHTYVCTTDAVNAGFCSTATLGQFIVNLPPGRALNDTSIWSASVRFANMTSPATNTTTGIDFPMPPSNGSDLWNNPAGNPVLPPGDENYTSPFRIRDDSLVARQPTTANILSYTSPITYPVSYKGYYCVGTIPITVLSTLQETQSASHAAFTGTVVFRNIFDGLLPASEYPKIAFYLAMTMAYTVVGAVWGYLCFRHREDLLPLQYYVASLIGILVIEMLASWGYYRYLNVHGKGFTSTVFLFVVAILDAGRNSLSFFLLLIVSLGLSVVKESLGPLMTRCVVLAILHFVFGVLYAYGTVELSLETASVFLVLGFVVPLAFTLSCFLLWILYSLSATINELAARRQHYKMSMFTRLNRILMVAVIVMAVFFVVSSLSFSNRLAEDYASNSWSSRWWILDGWLALLYLAVFVSIAYIWRPTDNNRYLAMVDELAQDIDEAENYDLEALQRRDYSKAEDDVDDAPGVGRDDIVFEIGEEEMDDETVVGVTPRSGRTVRERDGAGDEREELIGNGLQNGRVKDRDD